MDFTDDPAGRNSLGSVKAPNLELTAKALTERTGMPLLWGAQD